MKAFLFASLVFGASAFAESDFFGLPVTPAPRPASAAATAREKAAAVMGSWIFRVSQGERKVTLSPDGRVAFASGEDSGRWTIDGDFLVMHWSNGWQNRAPLAAHDNQQNWDSLAPGTTTWVVGNLAVTRVAESTPASSAQSGPANEVNAITDRFTQESAKLSAAEAAALAPVNSAYVKELEKLREAAKAKADLDTLVAVEAALQAGRNGKFPPPAKVPVPGLEPLRVNYEKSKAQALHAFDSQRSRVDADYNRVMNELEQRFTRAGNLDGAKQVRDAQLAPPVGIAVDVMPFMTGEHESRDAWFVVKDDDHHLRTAVTFQPPLEIEYVFKTDGQIRFGYACDELIFNWEGNRNELRIGGGPANGQHRPGAGNIPTKQVLTMKQVILTDQMTVSIDGRERGRWSAVFSGINEPIELWGSHGSTVWLKQVIVRKLP